MWNQSLTYVYGTSHICCFFPKKYIYQEIKQILKIVLNKSVTNMGRVARAAGSPTNHHFKHLLHNKHCIYCTTCAKSAQNVLQISFAQSRKKKRRNVFINLWIHRNVILIKKWNPKFVEVLKLRNDCWQIGQRCFAVSLFSAFQFQLVKSANFCNFSSHMKYLGGG